MRPFLISLAFIASGCATTARLASPSPLPPDPGEWANWPLVATPPLEQAPPPSRLAARASALVGLSTLRVKAPHLPDDCTGLTRAVYEDSGIELMGAGVRGDNGVTAMYRRAFERSALHTHSPAPGDLVFFKETYDRNRDGRFNDGLTHVGVVESVDVTGTVTFVHRVNGGVKRARLHVSAPKDRRRNDYLRPAKKGSRPVLTGELFVTYASAERLSATLVSSMSPSRTQDEGPGPQRR